MNKMRHLRKWNTAASWALLPIVVVLILPLFPSTGCRAALGIYKWIYGIAALAFTVCRIAIASDKSASTMMRRVRRIDVWAAIAFCAAAIFWFYNDATLPPTAGMLAILRDTITLSLVGAVLLLFGTWRQSRQIRKEKDAY